MKQIASARPPKGLQQKSSKTERKKEKRKQDMPRKKVILQRHPTEQARTQCYHTRKNGIKKKVRELSILCDADIAHLSIPSEGQPSLFLGENTNLLAILDRFANIDPIMRERRRRQVIDSLRNSYKKRGHEISIDGLLQYSKSGSEEVEECRNRLRQIQEKIDAVNRNLSHWRNPDAVDDIFEIIVKEEILRNSLKLVHEQKARLEQRNGSTEPTTLEVPSVGFTLHNSHPPVQEVLHQELPQQDLSHHNISEGPVGIGAGFNFTPSGQIAQNLLGHENPINFDTQLSGYPVNPNHQSSNEVSDILLSQRAFSFPSMPNVLTVDGISESNFDSQSQIPQSTMNHEFPVSSEALLEERFGVANFTTSEVPSFDVAPIFSQPLEGVSNQVPPERDIALPEVFIGTVDNVARFNFHQYNQTTQNLLGHGYPTNLEASASARLVEPNHQLSTDSSDNLLSQRFSSFPSMSNELGENNILGSNLYPQSMMVDNIASHDFPAISETWSSIDVTKPWEEVLNFMPAQQDSNLSGPSQWANTNTQGLGQTQLYNEGFSLPGPSHNQATLGSVGPENPGGAGSSADDPLTNNNNGHYFGGGNSLSHHNDLFYF